MFPIVEAGSPALEGTTLPAFVVARDGLYLRKQSLLGLSQTKVERVAHLPRRQAISRLPAPEAPIGADGPGRRVLPSGLRAPANRGPRAALVAGRSLRAAGAFAIDDIGLGPAQARSRRACRPGPAWSARSTRTAPSRRLRVRPTKTTRRTSTDSTSSSAIYSGDGHRSRRRSSSTVIASASARARCSSGPERSCRRPTSGWPE